jgi:uncharacterized protein YjbI with pentapeptide repeats
VSRPGRGERQIRPQRRSTVQRALSLASVLASRACRSFSTAAQQIQTATINLRATASRAVEFLKVSAARVREALTPAPSRLAASARFPLHVPFSRHPHSVSQEYPGQALVEAARSLAADFWGAARWLRSVTVAFCTVRPEAPTVSVEYERRRLIEERAYGLSRERGTGTGSPETDWLMAEREVDEWLQGRPQRLKDLGEAANTSATHVNVSFLTFMFVWTFVALAVSATTDEQLLRGTIVTMPFVGVGVPIVDFFVLAPCFVLLLHLNLLLQLYFLSCRLHALDEALKQAATSEIRRIHQLKLFPLPFAHMLVGHEVRRCVHAIVLVFVWVTIIAMPLLLLIWAELRFLPYHSPTVAWIQRIAVFADTVLLVMFWPTSVWRNGGPVSGWVVFGLLLISFLMLSLVAATPGEWVESRAITHWLFDPEGAWFHRKLNLREAVLLAKETDPETLAALKRWDAKEQNHAIKKVTGLGLRARDLSYADLNAALLSKADLREARLQGTSLSGAWLQRADLYAARLEGAKLWFANLRGAGLWDARLQGADLREAQLQGANLRLAQLQGADLRWAQLQGAELWGAQLQGADLRKADLQGADLREALSAVLLATSRTSYSSPPLRSSASIASWNVIHALFARV